MASTTQPFQTAHAATEPPLTSGLHRLATNPSILKRYALPGPHVSVVMPIPIPGQAGDDLTKRWNATRTDLRRVGATDDALDHLDAAIEALNPCGYQVLLTANDDNAAYCWLTSAPDATMTRVGSLPALVPALAEVDRRPTLILAAVDRVGADLYAVDHTQIDECGSVDGETERIHKASGDGTDQARNQRHSEVVWDRNAELVGERLATLARQRNAARVILTGDRRAVDLITHRLAHHKELTIESVRAGGRHEPNTSQRLLAAALESARAAQVAKQETEIEELAEELGQHDQAVEGAVRTLQATADHRVKKLYIDAGSWRDHPHLDETIAAAAAQGAKVIAVNAPHLLDGIAAMLRIRYDDSPAR
jgi:hypothetical protein